jgi:hypothetical protein
MLCCRSSNQIFELEGRSGNIYGVVEESSPCFRLPRQVKTLTNGSPDNFYPLGVEENLIHFESIHTKAFPAFSLQCDWYPYLNMPHRFNVLNVIE